MKFTRYLALATCYLALAAICAAQVIIPGTDVEAATTAARGAVELATTAEAQAGTDTTRAITPAAWSAATAPLVNPRAPRQGLVFDGTSGASNTIPAFGTADFSVFAWVNPTDRSGVNGIMSGDSSSFAIYLTNSAGLVNVDKRGVVSVGVSTTATPLGVMSLIGYSRTGGVGTFWLNGVADGTAADTQDYSVAGSFVGAVNPITQNPFRGTLVPLVLNRALSDAEVLALHTSGAPAAADRGGSNTAINSSTVLNGGLGNPGYDTFSGASATGFSAAVSTNHNALVYSPNASVGWVGRKFKFVFSLTLNSGTAPTVMMRDASGNSVSAGTIASAGANSFVLTLTSGADQVYPTLFNENYAGGAPGDFVVSGLSVTPLGLLLATEANAPGLGAVWRNTSGTPDADIILPSSGVDWLLPGAENWLRTERSTNGYLVADQVVIPTNCTITDIWVRTTAASLALYDASGGGTEVANITPTSGVWYRYTGTITQTSTGKLYVGLASAVLTEFKIHYVAN